MVENAPRIVRVGHTPGDRPGADSEARVGPDHDHGRIPELPGEPSHRLVLVRGVVTELEHLAEHRDVAAWHRRNGAQGRRRRIGVGVVGIVHDRDASLMDLHPPRRSGGARHRLGGLPEVAAHGDRCGDRGCCVPCLVGSGHRKVHIDGLSAVDESEPSPAFVVDLHVERGDVGVVALPEGDGRPIVAKAVVFDRQDGDPTLGERLDELPLRSEHPVHITERLEMGAPDDRDHCDVGSHGRRERPDVTEVA